MLGERRHIRPSNLPLAEGLRAWVPHPPRCPELLPLELHFPHEGKGGTWEGLFLHALKCYRALKFCVFKYTDPSLGVSWFSLNTQNRASLSLKTESTKVMKKGWWNPGLVGNSTFWQPWRGLWKKENTMTLLLKSRGPKDLTSPLQSK